MPKSEQIHDLIADADWMPCFTPIGELASELVPCWKPNHGLDGNSDILAAHYDIPEMCVQIGGGNQPVKWSDGRYYYNAEN